jgi:uncharacterized membrane protein
MSKSKMELPQLLFLYKDTHKTIYIKEEDIPSTNFILKDFEKSMNIGISGKYGEEFEKIFAKEVKKYINSIKDNRKKVKKIFLENALMNFFPEDYEHIAIKNDKELEKLKKKFDIVKPKRDEEFSYWSLSKPIMDSAIEITSGQREKIGSTRLKRNEAQEDLSKIASSAKNPTFKQIVDNVSSKILKIDAGKELSVEKKKELRSALRKKGLKLSEISHEAQCRLKIPRK